MEQEKIRSILLLNRQTINMAGLIQSVKNAKINWRSKNLQLKGDQQLELLKME